MSNIQTRNCPSTMRTLRIMDWFGSPEAPLSIVRKEPQESFTLHAHEFSEIVIVFGGSALHVAGGESWPVTAGDVCVVGGSEAHDYQQIKDLRLINVLFRPEKVSLEPIGLSGFAGYQGLFSFESTSFKCRPPKRMLRLTAKKLSIALNYVDSLEYEIKMRKPGYSFMGLSYFMQLVCHLSRAYCESENSDPWARLRVLKAIDYLEAHFDEPIKVEELAKLCCMSKRNFARVFRIATASGPIAYHTKLRLARAAGTLRRSDENVTSVAYKMGFNDSNYFTRRFHEMFGVSPRDYRQRQELI
jgi:AraC-like DNA-binding protein/quercetin dioxygenase-like cupin family protein